MYKNIYAKKPLYLDWPVNSPKSFLPSGVTTGRLITTPLTFNNWFNLESVTTIFWFKNILFNTDKVVGLPLLICSNANNSGLLAKDFLAELKALVKNTPAALKPTCFHYNSLQLSL